MMTFPVRRAFVVSLCFAVLLFPSLASGSSLQPQIPSVESFTAEKGSFELLPSVRIIVDSKHGKEGSPSAYSFAQTFHSDLQSVASYPTLAPVELGPTIPGFVFFPVINIVVDPSLEYALFNSKSTDEGYDFEITEFTYTIKAAAPIGAWWGTRTLLQHIVTQRASGRETILFPVGSGSDAPGWEIRGFMLDAGRHWFTTSFLSEICTYMSFFKLNELHLHSSDNLWIPDILYSSNWTELYAAFRFQPLSGSPNEGLVTRKNESWTQSEWEDLQQNCAAHGVTLIPEIESPGHALVISQWKPELRIISEPDDLNLSVPDTIPTIKAIWDEFLPWFDSDEVSIGADEYDSSLANDYISFVNEMSDYIHETSGKHIRIWGTYEPSTTMSVSKNITIQHWNFPDDDLPVQLMEEGYYVINSEQYFLYLDGKTSDGGQFPQSLNEELLWTGAPGGKGWMPTIFSPTDASNNTSIDNPMLRGSLFALWMDWGNPCCTALEVYYQLARSIAIFSEKAWAGSEVRASGLTRDQFDAVYDSLNAAAPGQNLNRVVKPEYGNVVYKYETPRPAFKTPVSTVGPPYTLTFSVKPGVHSPEAGILFSGTDSVLYVQNLTFVPTSTNVSYPLNYELPSNKYTDVAIHATTDYTYAVIDGNQENKYFYNTGLDLWGDYTAIVNMSFAAPAQEIGGAGFQGSIKDVSLTLGA